MAVTHTSSFYDTIPGKGVDEIQWAKGLPSIGSSEYGVKAAGDWKVTGVAGAPFTLAIAPGTGWCHGVTDTTTQQDTMTLPTLSSGTRWDLIVAKYDWKPTGGGPTAFTRITNSGQQIPTSRKNVPGDEVDQPLALVQWTFGQTQPTQIIDLRCWAGNGGVVAADVLALGYLARPGADVLIGSTPWRYAQGANNVWGWVDQSPKVATQTAAGDMSAADKKKLDAATAVDTVSTLMVRDTAGRARVKNPAAATDIANKGYADGLVAKLAYAMAAGYVSVAPVDPGGSSTAVITFPAGRFDVPPVVTLTPESDRLTAGVSTPSKSSAAISCYNVTNKTTGQSTRVHWTAVQMKPTSAPG